MNSIYLKFLLFLSPFLVVLGWAEIQVYKTGETVPFTKVIDKQLSAENETYYYRQLLNNNLNAYKLEMMNRQKPDIITLGQSIVLNFRDFMFDPMEDKFYNCGHLINNIDDIEHVVNLMKEGNLHRPKMVIFGLDGGIPKKNNWLDFSKNFKYGFSDRAYDLNAHMHALQNFFKYTFFGKKRIPKGDSEVGFGYFGQLGNGYRKDGSFHMVKRTSEFLKAPVFTDDRNAIESFDAHRFSFSGEWEIDQSKTPRLLKAFADMKAMNIEVIIYMAPYSDYFLSHCFTNGEFVEYWNQFVELQEQIIDAGYPMFRLRKPTDLGLDDRFFQDAYHPGEVIVGLQFYEFLNTGAAGSELLLKVDKIKLKNHLLNPKTYPLSFQIESPLLLSKMDTIPQHDSLFSGMKLLHQVLENGFPETDYERIFE